jgi:hypothetical protein
MQEIFPSGHSTIPISTPLHVTQLIYQYIRYTFQNQPSTYPFLWNSDPDTTKIVFDTVYNKESKVYGNRPIIVYSTGTMSSGVITTYDLATQSIKLQNSYKVNLVNSSVILKVLSRKFIEVEILKNEIFSCLVAIRTLLPGITPIHMVTETTASETQKFKQDEIMYVSEIHMNYILQYVWKHDIKQEIMNQIGLFFKDTGTEFLFSKVPEVP